MFYKLLIDSEKIHNVCSLKNSKINTRLSENLNEYILNSSNGVINMEELQKKVTPIIKDIDIFISYDHADSKKALYLARQLEHYDYKVFLDSLFWENIDEITDSFNRKYNANGNSLNYQKIKKSISTFNMILTDSIIETVRNSKFFIFVRNQDSKNDSRTKSPWIYLENKIAAYCAYSQNKVLFEDSQTAPQIRFKLDILEGTEFNSIRDIVCFIRRHIWEIYLINIAFNFGLNIV